MRERKGLKVTSKSATISRHREDEAGELGTEACWAAEKMQYPHPLDVFQRHQSTLVLN